MKTKRILFGTILAACAATAPSPSQAATPEVTDVTMTQSGSGRLVTITYRLTGDAVVTLDVQTNATPNAATGWTSIGGAAICNAQGAVWRKVTGADADGSGTYTITWRPDLSWFDEFGNGFKIADGCAKAVVTAWSLNNTPNYMVVDISAAARPNTQKYYPSADFLPGGLLGNPDYRTTSLVMRKIMAKDVEWTMGSTTVEDQRTSVEATHKVALTNNYYIGVFEVTQSQWSLIATNSPSSANFTTEKAMRPRELVCYNEIRLKANSTVAATDSEIRTYSWPKNPHPSSFLGLLNLKSGLDFDLPSEAQWEFAARAGNGVGYWGNGSAIMNADTDANLNLLGRYERNGGKISSGTSYVNPSSDCGVTNGTAIVGSYAPNAWGLYDMHGNVWEWCLDWYAADISGIGGKVNIDPDAPANTLSGGPVSGGNRVKRSGSWADVAGLCRPANHTADEPQRRGWSNGLRVVCTAGLQ